MVKGMTTPELKELRNQIDDEIRYRNKASFIYKVGDCFVSMSAIKGIAICRIDSLDNDIELTLIYVDAMNNATKSGLHCGYSEFTEVWKDRINPKIFEEYSENFKAITELKNNFVKKIKEYAKS